MGWIERRWQDDEEAIARMQSRYAATGDLTKGKSEEPKDKKDGGDKK